MDENDYLRFFTHCILQLTSEPRKVYFDPEIEITQYENIHQQIVGAEPFQDGYKNRLIRGAHLSNNTRFLYEKYENKFKKPAGFLGLGRKTADFRNEWLDVSTLIAESISNSTVTKDELIINYEYIRHTLEKNNVKMGVFDWWGQDDDERHLMNRKYWKDEYLLPDYKCLREVMEQNNIWDESEQSGLGHLNKEQNLQVAKILNRVINDRKFLQQ